MAISMRQQAPVGPAPTPRRIVGAMEMRADLHRSRGTMMPRQHLCRRSARHIAQRSYGALGRARATTNRGSDGNARQPSQKPGDDDAAPAPLPAERPSRRHSARHIAPAPRRIVGAMGMRVYLQRSRGTRLRRQHPRRRSARHIAQRSYGDWIWCGARAVSAARDSGARAGGRHRSSCR